MSPLHGLRLNCLLAPLTVALLGAAAVILAYGWHRTAVGSLAADAHATALVGLARLLEADAAPALGAWRAAHPDWIAIAQIQVRNETVVVLASTGDVPIRNEASPDLMLSYQGSRHWRDGRRFVYASPCLPQAGASSVVVGWRDQDPEPSQWPWLALAGGVLLLGGGMGSYLVARVYRPVEWCQRAAEAAAHGADMPAGAPDGPETESLRSSIATLIARRRHSDGADGDDHA
jgi:hypothetical protein